MNRDDVLRRLGSEKTAEAVAIHEAIRSDVNEEAFLRFMEKYNQWGASFREATYPDNEVILRLRKAVDDLEASLKTARGMGWANGLPDIRKRAADIVNQAYFASDTGRLSVTSKATDLLSTAAVESDEAPD